MNYNNLPEEIKSKIMFCGYIVHPIAKVFKDFKNDNLDLINNSTYHQNLTRGLVLDEDLSMYEYLKEMEYFNKTIIYYDDIWL